MRSRVMTLNGNDLVLGANDTLPELKGIAVAGKVEVKPGECVFVVV